MKRSPIILLFALMLFLVSSCNLDSFDFNKLSDEMNLNPSLVAPVAKANISVWDLLQTANKENDDLITKDPVTGLVKIVYTQNDWYKYNVRDFLNFPTSQSFSSGDKQLGEISPGDVLVSRNITLLELANTLNGPLAALVPFNGMTVPFPAFTFNGPAQPYSLNQITDYTTITVSKGSFEISMENKLKVPVTIKGNLYDLVYNRKIIDFTFPNVAPNSSTKTSVNLAGIQLSNKVEFRMDNFATTGSAGGVLINTSDYFKLSFDLKGLGISAGNLMIKSQLLEGFAGNFDFKFPEADLKAFSSVLKKGTLNIKTVNSSKVTGTINLTLNEIKKNGLPVKASIPLNGTTTTIDLTGAELNFASDLVVPYNRIPYTYSIQINSSAGYVNYAASDAIKLDVTLLSLDFKSIHGDFGKRLITIAPGNFDLNVEMLDKISGNFKLVNPKMEMILRNSIGVPASVSVDFTASNSSGKTAALNPPVFDIPVPANITSGIATKSVVFDKLNSKIVDFIALPPTGKISYSGKVEFNKLTPVTSLKPNFLDLDATFAIDLKMDLPMELQVNNLSFKDTTGISGGDFEQVESAELILNAKNGIPLDVDLQLFFVDTISKKQYGTSKKTKILSAAQVGADNKITPVQASQTFSLDKSEMENLRKANGIVFTGTVSSPSAGTGVATILSDSKIELNVVIKSKINL